MKRLYPILILTVLILGACARSKSGPTAAGEGEVPYGDTSAQIAGAMARMSNQADIEAMCAGNADCFKPVRGSAR